MIQQLVPLDKALMAARIDAKEVVDAIQNVLMDDETLAAACLTQQASFCSIIRFYLVGFVTVQSPRNP
jgi:hypothetical protein